MTPLKFQIVITGPQLFLKENIHQNYLISKYLHKMSSKLGNLYFIFDFSGVINPYEFDFYDFRSDYLGEYQAKRFLLLIRDLYGVDWWRKPRVENLVLLSL
jgi:hypothetical protein